MTYQELLTEIKYLSLDERLALLEALTHSLRDELRPAGHARSSASQVRGMLKPDGPLTPKCPTPTLEHTETGG